MTPLTHPERVAAAVEPTCRVLALLHDAVEDGHVGINEAMSALTENQGRALDLLSRLEHQTYAEYINQIRTYPGAPGAYARTVKIADLRDNLYGRPEGPPPDSLRKRYERALAILEAVDIP